MCSFIDIFIKTNKKYLIYCYDLYSPLLGAKNNVIVLLLLYNEVVEIFFFIQDRVNTYNIQN